MSLDNIKFNAYLTFSILHFICILQTFRAFELNTVSSLYRCSGGSDVNKSRTESELVHTVPNCRQKIRLALNIKNVQKSPEEVKYVFVNSVVNVETGIKLKLLNPLAVRFRQEQVLLAYPMKYLTAVNSKASEYVINYENRSNFTGCDEESPINPTCGIKYEKGVAVEYSKGFCCYCPKIPTKGKQARGGQDCSLAASPSPKIDLFAYKASAHCLRKSNIWYTVNALDEPNIEHQLFVQVYNKRHLKNGSSTWVTLTGGEEYALGFHNPYQYDENETIAVTHVTEKPAEGSITISYQQNRVLVPQPLVGGDVKNVPEAVKNGPLHYLVLSKDIINSDGTECDKAGVSYKGFYLQSDHCDVPRNTCLKNQPLDFWESDVAKEKAGKKGNYLLKNFGVPYKDPVLIDKETNEHWLALEYYKSHRSSVYIETVADSIVTLNVGKYAQILHVITESTSKVINFYIRILNSGLVSSEFTVQAANCTYSVPSSNLKTDVISPQLNVDFVVTTKPGNIQLTEKFKCTVTVRSALYGVIAKRRVTVRPKTRCICNFHCLCVCLDESLSCEPMSETAYHQAGFRGSLPVLTAKPPRKPWIVKHPTAAIFAAVLILLLLGFIKASFGLVGLDSLGEFGLHHMLYKPKKMESYPDPAFENFQVVYDDDGYPLHPNTGNRYKTYNVKYLFLMNFFFFFFYPCNKLYQMLRKNHSLYEEIPVEDIEIEVSDTTHRASTSKGNQKKSLSETSAAMMVHSEIPTTSRIQKADVDEEEENPTGEKFKGAVSKLTHIIQ